jgi:hypothetical protein
MPSTDDIWDAAAEEKWWREELDMMRHGTSAIAGCKTNGFYTACLGGLDAATHFTKPECFVSRVAFVAELRRLVTDPTAPSRPVPSLERYQQAQGRWLQVIIRRYDRGS